MRTRIVLCLLIAVGGLAGCREKPREDVRVVPQLGPLRPRQVVFAPTDPNLLIVLEAAGRVGVWDIRSATAPVLTASINAGALDVGFGSDGRSLVTTGFDGRVRRWSTDGKLLWVSPEGHSGPARALAVTPDFIVTGSDGGELRVWNAADGTARGPALVGHSAPVLSLAVSPRGDLASMGADGTLRRWTPVPGKAGVFEAQILHQQDNAPNPESLRGKLRFDPIFAPHVVAYAPSGTLGASLFDGVLRLWPPDGGSAVAIPAAHAQLEVRAIAVSPKGDRLATGGLDGHLRLWNPNGSRQGESIHAHGGGVNAVAFAADGRRLASTGGDGRVRLWRDGQPIAELPARQDEQLTTMAMSPTDLLAAVATRAGAARFASLDGGPNTPLPAEELRVTALAFHPVGKPLTVGDEAGGVRAFNLDGSAGAQLLPANRWVSSALRYATRSWLAAAGKTLRILSPELTMYEAQAVALDSFTSAAFAPGGEVIVAGTLLGRIHILNRDGSPRVLPFKLEREHIVGLAFAQEGAVFASAGGMESIVRVWRLDGTADGQPLEGHFDTVTTLASLPNASLLASGSIDGTVRLWKLPDRHAEVIDIGLPVDQVGFWRSALWVRAGGDTVFWFNPDRELVATSVLRPEGTLTFTPKGWFIGNLPMRAFDRANLPVAERDLKERASSEIVRAIMQRGASAVTPAPFDPTAAAAIGWTPAAP